MSRVSNYLEVYSLQEIIEFNDLTEEEVLDYLVTQNFLALPEVQLVDLEHE